VQLDVFLRAGTRQQLSARRFAWSGALAVAGALGTAGVILFFHVDLREYWDGVTRADSPLLVAAVAVFPLLGATATVCVAMYLARRAERVVTRPAGGWLAAASAAGLLASFSLNSYGWISWGDGFWKADATGIGEVGPWFELPMILAPVVGIPLFVSLGVVCLMRWLQGLVISETREASPGADPAASGGVVGRPASICPRRD
jgi:hypothetical protein